MCRLLGYAAPAPTTVRSLLGAGELDRFQQLSCVHGDGWGTSWLPAGSDGASGAAGALDRYRSAEPAVADGHAFAHHTGGVASTARIVHLRWATAGYEVDLRNSHPFHRDGVSFAHNGAINPIAAVEALLRSATIEALDGTTDSERYFALIGQELQDQPGDVAAAVLRTVTSLRQAVPRSSLNALVLSPAELVVVHANADARGPAAGLRALGDQAPLDHVDAYYQMRWRRQADGAVLVVSSGLDATGWTPVPPDSVLRVDLGTLDVTVRLLDGSRLDVLI